MRTTKDGACIIRARLHYAWLFQPREKEVDREDKDGTVTKVKIHQYEALLLIPKQPGPFTHREHTPQGDIDGLQEAIKQSAMKKFPDLAGVLIPLSDGDSKGNSGMETPKWPGYWHMNVKQQAGEGRAPIILRDSTMGVPKESDWKWGDWADVKINFSAYHNKRKGVSAYLQGVQFWFVDDKLGGGGAPSDDGFEADPNATTSKAASDPDDPFAEE